MNVDWGWAKQRPHFLAQHLSCLNDLVILYPYAWRRGNLTKNRSEGLRLYPFFRLPFGGRVPYIGQLNKLLLRMIAGAFLRWYRPDVIWVSSPELFECLPSALNARLVYDCMDDVLAFPRNSSRKSSLALSEESLIKASAQVFCSSENLRAKLMARIEIPESCFVVHNAYEPAALSILPSPSSGAQENKSYCVLGYIGTISSWFDFGALLKIVNEFPNIEIELLGPVADVEVSLPEHGRIRYLGAISHDDLAMYVCRWDALLMPFHVTELIQSVDPVKLYEYIYFDKPIISVWYAELSRFSEFVDFYDSHEELVATLDCFLREGFRKKFSDASRLRFIEANTWACRARQVQECLSCVNE